MLVKRVTEAWFHIIDFPFPKTDVFSPSVLCGCGLLLYVLSGEMLSSSLAEVLYSIVVLLPRAWKRLHLFVAWVQKCISVGFPVLRAGQAVLKSCSFDRSHP